MFQMVQSYELRENMPLYFSILPHFSLFEKQPLISSHAVSDASHLAPRMVESSIQMY